MLSLLLVVAASLGGSVISGLLGVGGGLILVFLLIYLPGTLSLPVFELKMITGMATVQNFVAAISGFLVYRQEQSYDRSSVYALSVGGAGGAALGVMASHWLASQVLLYLLVSFSVVSAALMLVPVTARENLPPTYLPRWAKVAAGGGVGFFGGALGLGSGLLLLPLTVHILRLPVRQAIGTSLVTSFFIAVTTFAGKLGAGQIDPLLAAGVCAGAITGARLGARLSLRLPAATLRLLLATAIAAAALNALRGGL